MKLLGVVALGGILLGCGGKAAETTSGDSPTLGGAGGTDAIDAGSPAGRESIGGSSDAGDAAGASSLSTLIACAPQISGVMPRPVCVTNYTPGLACDPSTFQICSTPGDQAEIWCGRPASCVPVTLPVGDGNNANPCVGSCPTLDESCSWVVNNMGGGVTLFTCCHDYESGLPDEGGLVWKVGGECVIGPK